MNESDAESNFIKNMFSSIKTRLNAKIHLNTFMQRRL